MVVGGWPELRGWWLVVGFAKSSRFGWLVKKAAKSPRCPNCFDVPPNPTVFKVERLDNRLIRLKLIRLKLIRLKLIRLNVLIRLKAD